MVGFGNGTVCRVLSGTAAGREPRRCTRRLWTLPQVFFPSVARVEVGTDPEALRWFRKGTETWLIEETLNGIKVRFRTRIPTDTGSDRGRVPGEDSGTEGMSSARGRLNVWEWKDRNLFQSENPARPRAGISRKEPERSDPGPVSGAPLKRPWRCVIMPCAPGRPTAAGHGDTWRGWNRRP